MSAARKRHATEKYANAFGPPFHSEGSTRLFFADRAMKDPDAPA